MTGCLLPVICFKWKQWLSLLYYRLSSCDYKWVFGSLNRRGALDQSDGRHRQVSASSVYNWPVGRSKKVRKNSPRRGFNTRYKRCAIRSQWALIASWTQSQERMPKQAARFSVPVFLGTALAKSPNAFVTSNIFPARFDAAACILKNVCEQKIRMAYFCLPLMSHNNFRTQVQANSFCY